MAKRFLTPIGILNLASDPATGSDGQIYYNSTSDILKIYVNGAWTAIEGGGGAAINVSASAPVSPEEGDAWFDNTDGKFYVYDGSFWVETGQTDAVFSSYNRWTKVISASTVNITGIDDNGTNLDYSPGLEQVYINGVFIDESSYTATSGSAIVLDEAVFSTDLVEVLWLENLVVADTYSKAESDAKYLSLSTASSNYLTILSASTTYATKTELNNINLTSAINTASAAAFASASAYTNSQISSIDLTSTINTASAAAVNFLVDGAPAALNTLNELAAALDDNADILDVYLTQSSASNIYLTQSNGITAAAASATYIPQSSPVTSFKNKIINGGFDIWQRGTSFTTGSSSTYVYTADRWNMFNYGTNTASCSQQAFTPGIAPVSGYEGQYFARFNSSSTFNFFSYRVEDVRTLAGQSTTFSFWAKSNSNQNLSIGINQNFGSGGSTAVTNIISGTAALTTSWQRFTFTGTMSSVSGKTIGTSSYVYIEFVGAINNAIDIWGAQLEKGSIATEFEQRFIGDELRLCQRYYEVLSLNTGPMAINDNAKLSGIAFYRVTKRVVPTSTSGSSTAVNIPFIGVKNVLAFASSTDSISFQIDHAPSVGQGFSYSGIDIRVSSEL
jgi:hypothetical protein